MINLKGRSFLSVKDITPTEFRALLNVAAEFKQNRYTGVKNYTHQGKKIALLFEKTSTRTRSAFVTAAVDLGVHPEYLAKEDIQLGKKESIIDTAKVLGRMFDGIEFRGYEHSTIEALAKYAGVPVWNGLTDKYHPTQVLGDFMTLEEHVGPLRNVRLAYVGDGRNNVATSLMLGAALMGLDFRIATPRELWPDENDVNEARGLIKKFQTHGELTITDSPQEAVSGVDAVYTDVWVSMGEEDKIAERIKLLKDYQVNRELLGATGNPEVKFLHCLPSFHDDKTTFGKFVLDEYGLPAMEVTDEVFQSSANIAFDEAENRVYTIQAVIAMTL